jgi:hypothetical protein
MLTWYSAITSNFCGSNIFVKHKQSARTNQQRFGLIIFCFCGLCFFFCGKTVTSCFICHLISHHHIKILVTLNSSSLISLWTSLLINNAENVVKHV